MSFYAFTLAYHHKDCTDAVSQNSTTLETQHFFGWPKFNNNSVQYVFSVNTEQIRCPTVM